MFTHGYHINVLVNVSNFDMLCPWIMFSVHYCFLSRGSKSFSYGSWGFYTFHYMKITFQICKYKDSPLRGSIKVILLGWYCPGYFFNHVINANVFLNIHIKDNMSVSFNCRYLWLVHVFITRNANVNAIYMVVPLTESAPSVSFSIISSTSCASASSVIAGRLAVAPTANWI